MIRHAGNMPTRKPPRCATRPIFRPLAVLYLALVSGRRLVPPSVVDAAPGSERPRVRSSAPASAPPMLRMPQDTAPAPAYAPAIGYAPQTSYPPPPGNANTSDLNRQELNRQYGPPSYPP